MERLTYWSNGEVQGVSESNIDDVIKRIAEYEDKGLEPSEIKKQFDELELLKKNYRALQDLAQGWRDKVHSYEQKLVDGRMVELPKNNIKNGDTVWITGMLATDTPLRGKIKKIKITQNEILFECICFAKVKFECEFNLSHIGKDVFFSYIEANKKALELEGLK